MDNKIISKKTMKKAGAALVVCVVALGGLGWYGHQQKINQFHNVAQANSKIVETKLAANNVEVIDEASVKAAAAEAMGVDESSISWSEIILCDGPGAHFMAGNSFDGRRGPYNAGRGFGRNHDANDHCPNWDHNNDNNDNNGDDRVGGYNGYHRGPHHGGYHHYAGNQGGPMNGYQGGPMNGPQFGPGMGMSKEATEQQAQNQPQNQSQPQDTTNQTAPPKMEFHPVYNVLCNANKVDYMVHVDAVTGKVLHCRAIASR